MVLLGKQVVEIVVFNGQGLYRMWFFSKWRRHQYTDLGPLSLSTKSFWKRVVSRPLHSPCQLPGTAPVSVMGHGHSNAKTKRVQSRRDSEAGKEIQTRRAAKEKLLKGESVCALETCYWPLLPFPRHQEY